MQSYTLFNQYKSLLQSCVTIAKEEGTAALWKGITPRLMRIMPGRECNGASADDAAGVARCIRSLFFQLSSPYPEAITFMTYEAVTAQLERNAFPLNLLIFNK